MAIISHVVIPGLTPEKYDEVRKHAIWLDVPPDGGLVHITWWEGDDCHNFDVWESEEKWAKFGADRLGPAMAQAGVAIEPQATFHAPHEVFIPGAVMLT